MKALISLALCVALVGCACDPIIKTETVYVDKPIPFVPKPPDVPKFVSKVDTLAPTDISDPGKVGQAYKYDVIALRNLLRIHEQILAQYSSSSVNFDDIQKQIDQIYSDINKAPSAASPASAASASK